MNSEERGYMIEHMKMTQDIITRMNKNSFQLKGWMITVAAAFLALYGSTGKVVYIWTAIAPVIVFWMLDSFYLKEERKYVGLYNDLVNEFNGIVEDKRPLFDLSTKRYAEGVRYSYIHVMFSKTELGLYLVVIIGLIVTGVTVTNSLSES